MSGLGKVGEDNDDREIEGSMKEEGVEARR